MMKAKGKLTLHQPATYQILVPGHLDKNWAEWVEEMTITADSEGNNLPVTCLITTVDQAALHGLLRQLYSLGLPLISVTWINGG